MIKKRACGTIHASNADMSRAISTLNQAVATTAIQDNGKLITINTIFHVMVPLNTLSTMTKNNIDIAKADVNAIIKALNRDYNSNVTPGSPLTVKYKYRYPPPAYYKAMLALSASANIKFNCEKIMYAELKTPLIDNNNIDSKNIIIKGTTGSPPENPNKNLNIWLVDNLGGGILGYSVFPWDTINRPIYDGIVLERKASGVSAGVGYEQYGLNRTVTHEVGHWAGLYHTFQNPYTNGPINPTLTLTVDSNKNGKIDPEEQSYDCVKDTFLQIVPTYGNPFRTWKWPYTLLNNNGTPVIVKGIPQSGLWNCNIDDRTGKKKSWAMFTNYMDYSDDDAMFMFTRDQVTKMRLTLLALRPLVVTLSP